MKQRGSLSFFQDLKKTTRSSGIFESIVKNQDHRIRSIFVCVLCTTVSTFANDNFMCSSKSGFKKENVITCLMIPAYKCNTLFIFGRIG